MREGRGQARAEAVLVFRALARLSEAGRLRDDGRAFAVGADGELVRRGLAEGHERRGEGDHGHEGAEDLHFLRAISVLAGGYAGSSLRRRERVSARPFALRLDTAAKSSLARRSGRASGLAAQTAGVYHRLRSA